MNKGNMMIWKPRFGLAALLLIVSVLGAGFGLYGIYWRDVQAAEARSEAWRTRGFCIETVLESTGGGFFQGPILIGLWQERPADPEHAAVLLEGLRSESRLESLVIMDQVDSDLLAEQLAGLPNLRFLSVVGAKLTPKLCASIAQMPELVQLDLPACSGNTEALQKLSNCPKLETLSLIHSTLTMSEVVQLNLPQLHTLNLSSCAGPTLDLSKEGLGRLAKLEKLLLSDCVIQDIVRDSTLLKIKVLNLCRARVRDYRNLALAMPALKEVILDQTDLNETLSKQLQQFTNLKTVFLQRLDNQYVLVPYANWMSQPYDVRIQDYNLYPANQPMGIVESPFPSLEEQQWLKNFQNLHSAGYSQNGILPASP